MNSLRLTSANTEETAQLAAESIRGGGIVLYPTDTLYGLGADAFSDEAVEKIYAIKGREEGKPVHAIVADMEMAARYGEVGELARELAEKLPKGKITFIVKKREGMDAGICRGADTFGFRIPDNDFCMAMLANYGAPITATSANRSGEVTHREVGEVLAQLGGYGKEIGLVVDAGELPPSAASTVVDLATGPEPAILREGAIPAAAIWEALSARY